MSKIKDDKKYSYFPLKIKFNHDGVWQEKICKNLSEMPRGKKFVILESNLK